MTTETKDEATAALWGGRFQGQLHPIFEGLNQSLPFDRRMALEDVRGSVAWAKAIGAAGVLAAEEVTSIVAALGEIHELIAGGSSGIETSDAEDVHSFVEAELVKRVGDLGKKLHTGRSRNDQVATDLKLHLRAWAERLDAAAADLQSALVDLAAEHADTAIPGYTHLQRAQPVTFGHQCLAYAHMLERDRGRIADAAKRMDACPLGSGALAGAPFALDREALAAYLGFAASTRNSLDGVSDRDHALEFVFACTTTMLHLS
ncbi:MAG: argininosuccinate lyase, partial [Planctomycetota bacterium]|nr:argininosuccinate lyase [Planctomycetota bacterium]